MNPINGILSFLGICEMNKSNPFWLLGSWLHKQLAFANIAIRGKHRMELILGHRYGEVTNIHIRGHHRGIGNWVARFPVCPSRSSSTSSTAFPLVFGIMARLASRQSPTRFPF
jgi:hypothetical protein